jgi:hypothetical protein
MRICFIEDADHTFTRREPREALLDAIVADLSGRYRSAATLGAGFPAPAIAVDEAPAQSVAEIYISLLPSPRQLQDPVLVGLKDAVS